MGAYDIFKVFSLSILGPQDWALTYCSLAHYFNSGRDT